MGDKQRGASGTIALDGGFGSAANNPHWFPRTSVTAGAMFYSHDTEGAHQDSLHSSSKGCPTAAVSRVLTEPHHRHTN